MEFKPKKIDESVNTTRQNYLKEFVELILGIVAVLVGLLIIAKILTTLLIPYFPPEYETAIWDNIPGKSSLDKERPDIIKQQQSLQKLLDKIPDNIKPQGYKFRVIVTDSSEPNAFAVPGGVIVVTSGLLKELKTENALVFVLGHEMGHFKNKDHLHALGNGLVLTTFMLMISGTDADISSMVGNISSFMNNIHSRRQEIKADEWGLEVLNKTYGHAYGANEFFEKILSARKQYKVEGYISTHPLTEERIEHIDKIMKEKNYKSGKALKLSL